MAIYQNPYQFLSNNPIDVSPYNIDFDEPGQPDFATMFQMLDGNDFKLLNGEQFDLLGS